MTTRGPRSQNILGATKHAPKNDCVTELGHEIDKNGVGSKLRGKAIEGKRKKSFLRQNAEKAPLGQQGAGARGKLKNAPTKERGHLFHERTLSKAKGGPLANATWFRTGDPCGGAGGCG